MKWPNLASLLAVGALTSCTTMHNAAVSTFRVIDTPNAYLRKKLAVDQEQPGANTTAAATTPSANPSNPPQQPTSAQPPVPPVQTPGRVAAKEHEPEPPAEYETTGTPQMSNTHKPEPKPSATPRATLTQTSDLPYGKPVPGKPGYVFSPYDKSGGYVDVTGFTPGQKVTDPYSGKIFLVP